MRYREFFHWTVSRKNETRRRSLWTPFRSGLTGILLGLFYFTYKQLNSSKRQIKRHDIPQRLNWKTKLQRVGFTFYENYWTDDVAYELSEGAYSDLYEATLQLEKLTLQAVEVVLRDDQLLREFQIPEKFWPLIRESWNRRDPSIYGRYDLLYDGRSPPKMLEYNADTPTVLMESGPVQKEWFEDFAKAYEGEGKISQFNDLQHRLKEAWRELYWELRRRTSACKAATTPASNEGFQGDSLKEEEDTFYFCCVRDHEEDLKNTLYMKSLAQAAGFSTKLIYIDEIRWDGEKFVDLQNQTIKRSYKLYPWEWIFCETSHLDMFFEDVLWIEPPWKIILSNKAILPTLWKLFPHHPNLLPAYFTPDPFIETGKEYIEKPAAGREGENISIHRADGSIFEEYKIPTTKSQEEPLLPYGRMIYQKWVKPPSFSSTNNNVNIIFGSWVINHRPAAFVIREDHKLITNTDSYFRPHYILS